MSANNTDPVTVGAAAVAALAGPLGTKPRSAAWVVHDMLGDLAEVPDEETRRRILAAVAAFYGFKLEPLGRGAR